MTLHVDLGKVPNSIFDINHALQFAFYVKTNYLILKRERLCEGVGCNVFSQ